ncbi:MAG: sel1 repeat family protein [Alphaproteobacteria bacterium]|nr:sel1 repeat family protein [Alphaproteobacteria bacterium]
MFKKAAEQEKDLHVRGEAQSRLGQMYQRGQGVQKDYNMAQKYFTEASATYPFASILLGMMVLEVNQDYEGALKVFKKAAEQEGDHKVQAKAQIYIGEIYQRGQGVQQDYQEAHKWFLRASFVDPEGSFLMGKMYAAGEVLGMNDVNACFAYATAAKQGYAPAQHALGCMWANGRGLPKNHTKAFTWYAHAAEQGYPDALYEVGMRYQTGQGTTQNDSQAILWLTLAAQQGHTEAQAALQKLGLSFEKVESKNINSLKEKRKISALDNIINNKKDVLQENLFSNSEKKSKKSIAKFVPEVAQNAVDNQTIYTSQANAYISTAIQHAEDERWNLAEHMVEEANKKYDLAEDAKLANELYQAEFAEGKL